MRARTFRNAAAILVAAAASALASPVAAQPAASVDFGGESAVSRSIVLPVGKAAVVQLPKPAADVLVASPDIVDAVVRSPRRVFLLGQEVGQTNAFFFDAADRQILNLEIRVEQDVDALNDLFARLMPAARITAEAVNDNIILRGTVRSSVEAANAKDIAERFVGEEDSVVPMLTVQQREQVMLKVRVVEMQRSIVKQLGVDLGGAAAIFSGVGLQEAAISAASNVIGAGADGAGLDLSASRFFNPAGTTNVNGTLQALETVGIVKTLAEPTLTAVSGESANFLAGGEFPIPIGQNEDVITIEFREFGVGLGFTPLVLTKGRINLKVETEVSEISNANTFTLGGQTITLPGGVDADGNALPAQVISAGGLTIPSFTVRRAKTTVELPSGGSLMMAGLLQENLNQSVNGLPGLKDLPVLGQLFRSRDYANSETELVIVVTPYLVDHAHESELSGPDDGFVFASDAQHLLLGRIESQYGLAGAGVEEKTLQGPLGFILD